MRLSLVKINNFRNIENLKLEIPTTKNGQVIAIIGKNGAGKTSVLEGLSFLSPGRGLHKSKPENITQQDDKGKPLNNVGWSVFVEETGKGNIGIAFDGKKRQLKINGEMCANQSALTEIGSVLWLTPRQDRLFLDGPAPRRNFLDRLVYGLIPTHAITMAKYKHHAKARLRLLKNRAAVDWLKIEEQQAAEAGVQILQNRQQYLAGLAPHLQHVTLELTGATLNVLTESDPATALAGKFERSRERDFDTGTTGTGPQKVDLHGTLEINSQKIALIRSSSGQHKRGLVEIILAHARLLAAETGHLPLVLIDEISAHLDATRRKELITALTALGAQVWVTETEIDRLGGIKPDITFYLDKGSLIS